MEATPTSSVESFALRRVPPESGEMDVATTMMKMQAETMRKVALQLPLNSYGLPEGIFSPKILNDLDWEPSEDLEMPPREAWIPLDYSEGYPTIGASAIPFWELLEGESSTYHDYFRTYIDLVGVRSTYTMSALPSVHAKGGNTTLLAALKCVFYWEFRAKSFDLYVYAARTRNRIVAARTAEDEHLKLSRELSTKATELIQRRIENFSEKGIIDLLKLGINLERISVGLPAGGVSGVSGANGAGSGNVNVTDVKTIINNVTQHVVQSEGGGGRGGRGEGSKALLSKALQDPETADLFQRLALKVNDVEITPPEDGIGAQSGLELELELDGEGERDASEEAAAILANPTGFAG